MRNEMILNPIDVRRESSAVLDMCAVAGAMTLAAWAKVWLPFSPVPVSMQTLVVLLAGFAVGPTRATSGMILYAALGALGAPVLTQPFGPSFGYIIAFALVPPLMAQFRSPAAGALAATGLIYALGAGWLAWWMNLSLSAAFVMGVAPFLFGDVLKAALACKLSPYIR